MEELAETVNDVFNHLEYDTAVLFSEKLLETMHV